MNGMRLAGWLVAAMLVCAASGRGEMVLKVKELRCEYKVNPMGIDVQRPRLSWQLESTERNVLQTSYEVRVGQSEQELGEGKVVWTSGKVESEDSIQVEYGGAALESGRIYYWQVRVWDNHAHLSDWSPTAKWEMGLLDPKDWEAHWITPNLEEDETKSNPAPLLRKEFI